jgi:arylsulfatase A-like enzyme
MLNNLLLIVIDTARAKSFSSLGNKTNTTPALDALGREGMHFTKCFSPSPWTTPSHASLFTGLYPSQHGTYGRNMHFNQQSSLAYEFKKAGFKTFGISANKLVSSLNGFHKGFDVFLDPWMPFAEKPLEKDRSFIRVFGNEWTLKKRLSFLLSKEGINAHFDKRFGVNQNATYSTNRAMRFVKRIFRSVKERKFVFVNIMQPHDKYNPPRKYVRKLGYKYKKIDWPDVLGYYAGTVQIDEIGWKILLSLYEGEIRYADEKIGNLLEWMKKSGYLNDTLVIITSDHGELVGEHGHFTHFFSVHNELLHVPLIIYHPDYLGIGRKSELVQTHDLYRTLLEEFGISSPISTDLDEFNMINVLTGKREKAISQLLYPLWIKGVSRLNPSIDEATSELASRKFVLFRQNNNRLEKICWDSRKGVSIYDLDSDYGECAPLDLDNNEMKHVYDDLNRAASLVQFKMVEEEKFEFSADIINQLSGLGYM